MPMNAKGRKVMGEMMEEEHEQKGRRGTVRGSSRPNPFSKMRPGREMKGHGKAMRP